MITIQKVKVGRKGPPKNLSWISFDEVDKLVKHRVAEREIVIIEPGGYGGNHSHPRTETWLALGGELTLHYRDESGGVKQMVINPKGNTAMLVTIAAGVAHAVTNTSKSPGVLIEWSDGPLVDEKLIPVITLEK